MLLTKEVELTLKGKIIKWYEEKGYEIPRYTDIHGRTLIKKGTKLKVRVEDLQHGSEAKVDIQCDNCGEILLGIQWKKYNKYVREGGKYFCNKCAYELFAKEKIKKIKLDKSKSFYDWCYKNLPKEKADSIILRWDYDKNCISPKEVSYSAMGADNQGYWFKCIDYQEHESERKSINSFTRDISRGRQSNLNCNQCNRIVITNPELMLYLVNKEDAYKYSFGTNQKILLKCPKCGYGKSMNLNNFFSDGFGCPRCSDGVSYPEKFIFNLFEQLNIDFKYQLSKSILDWCDKYKYDFFIDKINGIVEVHGIQHYEKNYGVFGNLKGIKENDKEKEYLAKSNNISNYIILDCRYSKLEWVKDNIMKSQLPQLLNFKEADIDWSKCHEAGLNTFVKEACELWNSGITNTLEIANKLGLDRSTVTRYLKRGNEIGLCDYMRQTNAVKVICVTTNEIFNSVKQAATTYNLKNTSIVACCRNKLQSTGKLKDGTKLVWMYYDEWEKANKLMIQSKNE